jgi:hypothetical protein
MKGKPNQKTYGVLITIATKKLQTAGIGGSHL